MTGVTHAAINAFLEKLNHLRDCYCQIPNLSLEWLNNVSIEHVVRGLTHVKSDGDGIYIYAGTVFQVRRPILVYD